MNIIYAILGYIAIVNVASVVLYRKDAGEFSGVAFFNGVVGLLLIPIAFFTVIGAIENTIGSTGSSSYGEGFLFLWALNIIIATFFVGKHILTLK